MRIEMIRRKMVMQISISSEKFIMIKPNHSTMKYTPTMFKDTSLIETETTSFHCQQPHQSYRYFSSLSTGRPPLYLIYSTESMSLNFSNGNYILCIPASMNPPVDGKERLNLLGFPMAFLSTLPWIFKAQFPSTPLTSSSAEPLGHPELFSCSNNLIMLQESFVLS